MDVEHDVRQQKFYAVQKGVEYSLEYNVIEPGLWEFHCPYIPEGKKAMEIQDFIIEYALFFIRRNKIKLYNEGNCEYFSDFANRKKEFHDFLLR